MTNSAPAASACSWTIGPRSKPAMPCGKPGKFSIFSTLSTCPPGRHVLDQQRAQAEARAVQRRGEPASPPPTISRS